VKRGRREGRVKIKREGSKRKMKGGLGKGSYQWALIRTSLDKSNGGIFVEGGFLPRCKESLL
jgi:hypothetical protein